MALNAAAAVLVLVLVIGLVIGFARVIRGRATGTGGTDYDYEHDDEQEHADKTYGTYGYNVNELEARKNMEVTRRQFLGKSATAVIVAGTMAHGKVFGANDKIQMACIGFHGRGNEHIDAFGKGPESEVVGLCDVDKHVLEHHAEALEKRTGKKPKACVDMRDIMADKNIDAVSIATPNHWHSLAAIWACQAGKHVYVEKPLSHEVWEGRQLVEAAKKHNVVVMHGTQSRSSHKWLQAVAAMRKGIIGDVYMARALCYKNRDTIGIKEPKAPWDYLDWNLWQGPAQEKKFCENYVHYNWHWFWDYGNGDIGNQGVHQMDVATWGMNKGLPVKIQSSGGRYTYKDQGETPNTQVATFTYEDGTMTVFEVRGRATNSEGGTKVGNLFYGSGGYLVEGDGMKFFDTKDKEIPIEGVEKPDTLGEWRNFLRAVKSGKAEDNFAPASEGHIAAAHGHLANIAYRLGRTLKFDPKTEKFVDDAEADKLLTHEYRGDFKVPQIA